MKKVFIFLISLFSFILPVVGIEFDLNSKNALLYNLDENKILYEKNGEEKIAIASLTKIMTSIVAVENITNLEQKVLLTAKDFWGLAEANASVAGFKVGQRVSYRDLLYGLLLPSGADAAQALVNNIAGSRTKFVEMMNQKAQELGMVNTHFANETGLDNEDGYSTVKDVVLMFKYALNNAVLKEIIESSKYTMSDNSFKVESTTKSSIKNAQVNMDYVLGGKTGTTKKAGKCLVTVANYNNSNYILVTARADQTGYQNVLDAKKIYDYFMSHYEIKNIYQEGDLILSLPTQNLKADYINFYASETLVKYLPNEFQKEDLVYDYEGVTTITSKFHNKDKLGTLKVKYNDEILATIDIILNANLAIDYLKVIQNYLPEIIIILIIIIVLIIIWHKKKKRKNKKIR